MNRPAMLWTPQGSVSIAEKGIVPINRLEIDMLAKLESFAAHHDVNLWCKRCGSAIIGKNATTDTTLSVACQCREWVFTR